jgi:hypothetical protein
MLLRSSGNRLTVLIAFDQSSRSDSVRSTLLLLAPKNKAISLLLFEVTLAPNNTNDLQVRLYQFKSRAHNLSFVYRPRFTFINLLLHLRPDATTAALRSSDGRQGSARALHHRHSRPLLDDRDLSFAEDAVQSESSLVVLEQAKRHLSFITIKVC